MNVMNADDETNITDIQLLPDGRICVFGLSAEVLEVLDELQGGRDTVISGRMRAHQLPVAASAHPPLSNETDHD